MKKVTLLLGCLVGCIGFSTAQEQLGLRLDNYAGVNGLLFNPAAAATLPYSWDVNLIEGAQFLANNYVYFQERGLLDFRNPEGRKVVLAKDLQDPETPKGDNYILEFYDDGRTRYLLEMTSVLGPSFVVRLGEYHQIGLLSRVRQIGNARGVDTDFSYYPYDARPFFEDFQVAPFHLSLLLAGEIGLNYALTLPTADGALSLGLTAKMLTGFEGFYLDSPDAFTLSKLPGDSLRGQPFTFDFGYTDSNLGEDFTPRVNGGGFGLDLGLIYTIGGETPDQYRWKLGFALTDLGGIRFRTAARRHRVTTTQVTEIDAADYVTDFDDRTDLEPTVRQFSLDALGDPDASFVEDGFSMGLPTSVNLQADFNANDLIFINAAFMLGLPLNGRSAGKGSLLALTPRLEKPWYGAALPVSLYNGRDLRVGLALRLAFLSLGADDLGGIFGSRRLDSADAFFAIKFTPLLIPRFGKGKGGGDNGKMKGKGGKEPGCYRF